VFPFRYKDHLKVIRTQCSLDVEKVIAEPRPWMSQSSAGKALQQSNSIARSSMLQETAPYVKDNAPCARILLMTESKGSTQGQHTEFDSYCQQSLELVLKKIHCRQEES
jgi:hypothetical protein